MMTYSFLCDGPDFFLKILPCMTICCRATKSSTSAPVMILPHQEESVPLKVIRDGMTALSSTPKNVPIM